ncbi:Acetyltransferase (GNAT) family protein [Parasphingorhabdus marina DSM 22363]|uniref:Acetyltransferase (GNAT) family protein n=1 Tax=Parasphingorhabdus marina DSM 22363 TaxID=1123272 RepID=A0A1N6H404_9SPHN|nr:GNAT family N-acetyltransferase [Parasphingorhabdus marina]SIO14407.1 Acetyltransferase (GNAT) family protein [Parasphingorhabdus marina DSM 22363]
MTQTETEILPFDRTTHLDDLLKLTVRAWEPVFPKMERAIPGYVYDSFYPKGWKTRQLDDVRTMCKDPDVHLFITRTDGKMSGYLGVKSHEEDNMGEIYIIAVDPDFQRHGIGRTLMDFAFDWMRDEGLAMVMVETGGDPGHAPARAVYEDAGFERYPVARYFRKL